ncbi:MAG: hypothetical protein ACI8ZN_000229 [Bacteroidia bacterium]|jgi:hypothetical protein
MKKAIAIFFTLLMLLTNVGVTFATHYCGGKAVMSSLMLGQRDLNCGMIQTPTSCEHESLKSKTTSFSKSCCENQFEQLNVEDAFDGPATLKTSINTNFFAAFIHSFITRTSASSKMDVSYPRYSPPIQTQDITLLVQSFLI